jgi:hypothetical protein
MMWAQKHGIKQLLIELVSPTQNAYIESFNGTFAITVWMRADSNL